MRTFRRWRLSAFWLAMALVGQAVALRFIDAGTAIRYQHYRLLPELLYESPALLAVFAAQALCVAIGLSARRRPIAVWLSRTFSWWQCIALVVAFGSFGAAVSANPGFFVAELGWAALVHAVNLGNIVLFAWCLPADALPAIGRRLDRFLEGRPTAPRLDQFACVAGVWVSLLAACLCWFVYEAHPHVPDEVAYVMQARYLAAGTLTQPAPPVPEAFEIYLMRVAGDVWYPVTPPGWPAILAIGTAAGAPWMVNPLLAGINVLLAYMLIQRLYDRRTARLTVLLLCVSPWHVFMAMSFMTHTATLTAALAGALALTRLWSTGGVGGAVAAGAAAGLVSLIRPLDGVVVAASLALPLLALPRWGLRIRALTALGLSCVAVAAIVLPYNRLLVGDATVLPLMQYMDEYFAPNANAYGFGPDRGMGWPIDPLPGHGPIDALINAELNTFSINVELFGWSAGSLLLAATALFCRRLQKPDLALLAVIATTFAAYFFYYFGGGPDFGARYWYLMLVPCIVFTVRGIQFLQGSLDAAGAIRVLAAVLALCGLALVNYFPWRAADKYHRYLDMRPDVRRLAGELDFGESLVLIRGERFPDYTSAAVYNPLDLRTAAPVYAWDRSAAVRDALLAAYPNRPVWILNGPSVTGAGYEIVERPRPEPYP